MTTVNDATSTPVKTDKGNAFLSASSFKIFHNSINSNINNTANKVAEEIKKTYERNATIGPVTATTVTAITAEVASAAIRYSRKGASFVITARNLSDYPNGWRFKTGKMIIKRNRRIVARNPPFVLIENLLGYRVTYDRAGAKLFRVEYKTETQIKKLPWTRVEMLDSRHSKKEVWYD